MSPADEAARPLPAAAYQRWLDALAGAGWPGRPDPETELVPVEQSLGRVTAEPVTARWASPRVACAAMDGIAVRAADLAAAPTVTGDGERDDRERDNRERDNSERDGRERDGGARAGRTVRLAAGTFAWIDTGDPLPPGADTVVVRERVLPQADGGVHVAPAAEGTSAAHGHRPAAPGRHVRAAGEDFAAGDVLVPAGRRLRPGDLAAAAAGGHATLTALRRPAVAIIPTGDEIRPVGAVPHGGEILDTNSLMLAARCQQLRALPTVSDVVPDDPDLLAAELRRVCGLADLVLVIAGSSRGRDDHAASVLAQVGGVVVAGVALRPGHPALLGYAKRLGPQPGIAPVIGLPGYPLASAVAFERFAVPVLTALGARGPERERVTARLERDWDSPADVEEWVLVTLGPAGPDGTPAAGPARRGASSVSQLAQAAAWWRIPPGQGHFPAGAAIEVVLLPGA
ncbi:MAG TPA: molybdopterin molybdotransferase MoeA [Trebonia sp.]|nr:molybdopterin molybdotransferase MoeA [Trebonia sp.]